jgi:hypothetical protein
VYERDLLATKDAMEELKNSNAVKEQIIKLTNEKHSLMNYASTISEDVNRLTDELHKLHEELGAYRSE